MKQYISTLLFLLMAFSIQANEPEQFEPTGNPTLRIFGNFQSGLTSANNNSLFEIDRAYLGYQYYMTPNWMAEIKIDIGSPENELVYAMVKRYAYFRNVYIRYTKNKLSIDFGLVGMTHSNVQENFWGYRYILKSFNDEYRFGKSVDLGIVANYEVNNFLSFDASLVNGEGYSQLQTNNYFEYCLGTTLQLPDKLTARFYGNFGPSATYTKMVYAAFLGYNLSEKLSIGAEYNLLTNYKYLKGQNQRGYSAFGTFKINNKWKVFGRYDLLSSNILDGSDTPWNITSDGSALITGLEYQTNQHLKFSLNYRNWHATDTNINNTAYLFLNVEFKL